MTPAETAKAILEHAQYVKRLSPPGRLGSEPTRFYEERDAIAQGLTDLAGKIAPGRQLAVGAEKSIRIGPKTAPPPEQLIVNGRRVIVATKRSAFALTP